MNLSAEVGTWGHGVGGMDGGLHGRLGRGVLGCEGEGGGTSLVYQFRLCCCPDWYEDVVLVVRDPSAP